MMKRTPSTALRRRWPQAIVCFVIGVTSSSAAQEPRPLGEADVVRIARERAPASAVAEATERLADARAQTAGLLPNPSIAWDREAIETTGQRASQDIFRASIPLNFGGPRTERSLQASRSEWSRSTASLRRTSAVVEALHAYFDAALAAQRAEVLGRALTNLQEAARIQREREAAGVVSGYESTRLGIAMELARSRHIESLGNYESARARLAVLLGESDVAIDTNLALADLGSESALLQRTEERRALVHARGAEREADRAEQRSRLAWLPTVVLGGGLNRVSNLGGGLGYVLGASLTLPIFDRGQDLRAEAVAQQSLATARTEALRRNLRAEVRSALTVYRTAREELTRFEAETTQMLGTLLRAAQSGYREGERTILELLDAQNTQIEVAERRIALLWAAKHAETRLRAAVGELR